LKCGANAGIHHSGPTVSRLLPEWKGPSEVSGFHHLLVASPGGIDENVEPTGFFYHGVERDFGLAIVRVIATHASNFRRQTGFRDGPTGCKYPESSFRQANCYPAPDSATGSRDERYRLNVRHMFAFDDTRLGSPLQGEFGYDFVQGPVHPHEENRLGIRGLEPRGQATSFPLEVLDSKGLLGWETRSQSPSVPNRIFSYAASFSAIELVVFAMRIAFATPKNFKMLI
jgi:hypothetical protein